MCDRWGQRSKRCRRLCRACRIRPPGRPKKLSKQLTSPHSNVLRQPRPCLRLTLSWTVIGGRLSPSRCTPCPSPETCMRPHERLMSMMVLPQQPTHLLTETRAGITSSAHQHVPSLGSPYQSMEAHLPTTRLASIACALLQTAWHHQSRICMEAVQGNSQPPYLSIKLSAQPLNGQCEQQRMAFPSVLPANPFDASQEIIP